MTRADHERGSSTGQRRLVSRPQREHAVELAQLMRVARLEHDREDLSERAQQSLKLLERARWKHADAPARVGDVGPFWRCGVPLAGHGEPPVGPSVGTVEP